jgi:uncharacterized protein YwlG (UPF0340 family)
VNFANGKTDKTLVPYYVPYRLSRHVNETFLVETKLSQNVEIAILSVAPAAHAD